MKNFLSILLIAALFTACSKENSDVFSPYQNTAKDTVWNDQVSPNALVRQLMDTLKFPAKLDSFDLSTGATIRVSEFLQVTFPPFSFITGSGIPANGSVKVEIIYLRKKGDLVRFSRPTTSFGRILKNAGSFWIRATRNGQELTLAANANVKLKFTDPSPVNDMRVFYGVDNVPAPLPAGTNALFTWTPASDSSRISTFQQADSFGVVTRGYELLTKKLHWVSANFFYDTLQTPRTRLDVLLPINFTNANTEVFAVFNSEKVVVQSNALISSRSFNFANLPVGKSITLVSLSKVGTAYYMSVKPVTTTVNHAESLVPQLITLQQMTQYLDNF